MTFAFFFQYFFCLFFFSSCQSAQNQLPIMEKVGLLPSVLPENSGLVQLEDDLFVGLNDSGDQANLYVFSIKKKMATRVVKIINARNHDWEELTADKEFIYIGDMGNNDGDRKDLAIYKVRKEEVKKKSEVSAEKISFSYGNQDKFKSSGSNNFDCESMICVGDSLYLFSKNRGNFKTDLYSVSKFAGTYTLKKQATFDAGGLVTSADFRSGGMENQLVLIGYTPKSRGYTSFMIFFPHVWGTQFFKSVFKRIDLSTSLQIESVVFHDEHSVYITNEQSHGNAGMIYRVKIED